MSQIKILNLCYQYSDFYHPIFKKVNLILDTEWKAGLIGRNGRGKTTLLNLLMGNLEPDSGCIELPCEIDYFPYENAEGYAKVIDIIKENIGGLRTMEIIMDEIISSNNQSRFDEYNTILDNYIQMGGFEMEAKIQKEFELMKLDKVLLQRDFSTLSGGEKTSIQLIALFLKANHFILLDEPTNHLDADRKEMIIRYLNKQKGFILVSHDRYFLDEVVDHIISINKTDITIEHGNYSSWKQNKDLKEQFEGQTKVKLENEIKQLERRIKQNKVWAAIGQKQKYHFLCKARANGVKKLQRQSKNSRNIIKKNIDTKKQLLLNFEEKKQLIIKGGEFNEDWMIKVDKLNFTYPGSNRRILNNLSFNINFGDRLWIRGKNGSGKSTLLKILSSDLESDSVEYAETLKIVKVEQEPIWTNEMVKELFYQLKEVNNESFEYFQSICQCFDVPDDYLIRPIETYSIGERKKIDIAMALSQNINLIILDEPLNYMDVYFREQLEAALLECKTTLVFVEHDERFGDNLATKTLNLS